MLPKVGQDYLVAAGKTDSYSPSDSQIPPLGRSAPLAALLPGRGLDNGRLMEAAAFGVGAGLQEGNEPSWEALASQSQHIFPKKQCQCTDSHRLDMSQLRQLRSFTCHGHPIRASCDSAWSMLVGNFEPQGGRALSQVSQGSMVPVISAFQASQIRTFAQPWCGFWLYDFGG